nr:hypothetical protein CFP56_64977 [Quercus suber]
MNEQLSTLDFGLEHEITKSKAAMCTAIESSKVASCSDFDSALSLPSIVLFRSELDLLNSFMVSWTIDSNVEASSSKSNDLAPLPLNSASSFLVPLLMPPPPTTAVDFVSERTYYKSKSDLICIALNQVNQQFNIVNNTQFQPPIANATGITSYHNFADKFVPLQLNSAVIGVVSSVG